MSDVTLPAGIPVWPDTLPLPRIEGYGLAPQSNAIRTDIDSGAARMRLRSTSTLYRVRSEWRFSQEAFAVFDAWWMHVLNQGVLWFAMPLTAGLGVQAVQARFIAPWDTELLAGNRWQVKAQLEVQDFPRLSPDEVQVAAELGPDAIALGDRLHAWLNQTIVASDYW